MIADDCLRPLYDHLLSVAKEGNSEKIDLVLYTRGGSVETPWKIVTKIRQFCKQFNVIIPYRAHSGGTMIAIETKMRSTLFFFRDVG
jgi:ATP-dependent protease ClpP protease subunit